MSRGESRKDPHGLWALVPRPLGFFPCVGHLPSTWDDAWVMLNMTSALHTYAELAPGNFCQLSGLPWNSSTPESLRLFSVPISPPTHPLLHSVRRPKTLSWLYVSVSGLGQSLAVPEPLPPSVLEGERRSILGLFPWPTMTLRCVRCVQAQQIWCSARHKQVPGQERADTVFSGVAGRT